jgi:hypothetical protein
LILFGLLGMRGERRREGMILGVVSLFFLLLALGPTLHVAGEPVVPLPFYRVMAALFPFFPSVPARFVEPAILALLLGAGVGVRRCAQGRNPRLRHVGLLTALLGVVEFAPGPLHYSSPPTFPLAAVLASDPRVGRVVDLGAPELATYRQLLHGRPITGGFLARRPKRAERQARRNPLLRYVRDGKGTVEGARGGLSGIDGVIVDRDGSGAIERADVVLEGWRRHEDPFTVVYLAAR